MNAKTESSSNSLNLVWWLLALAVIVGGIYANSVYVAVAVIYRALIGVVVGGIALALLLQTDSGKAVWSLAKESRVEVRKVVWPTGVELRQTTIIVVIAIIVVAFLLWGLDSGLSWIIQAIIG